METTADQDSLMSAAELLARDIAGNGASSGRGNAGPFNGLSATTAAELQQLARAALTGAQPTNPLFTANDALAAAVGSSNNQHVLSSDPLAAVSAALAGFTGQPQVVAAQPAALTEGALNALFLSGINLANFNTAGLSGYLGADLAGVQLAAGLPPGIAAGGAREADEDDAMGKGAQGNKQLSSRFRGVCWNKKNKRWQAAINSGGKYIYLGSFTSEEDAARQFDRAAIKIRGKKAKLNYLYADYVDGDGNLLEDLVLPLGPAGGSSGGGRKGKGGAAAGNDSGFMLGQAGDAASAGLVGSDMLNQAALALLQQGQWAAGAVLGGRAAGDGDVVHSNKGRALSSLLDMSDLKAILPKGCSLDYTVQGLDAEMFGLVYKSDATGQRGCGVWTGYRLHLFGMYADEQDAKQSVQKSMQMLHEDRQLRAGGGGSGSTAGAAGLAVQADVGLAGGAGSAAEDPLLAALGLGGLRAGRLAAAVGAGPAASSAAAPGAAPAAAPGTAGTRSGLGLLFETARAAEGVGGLANYDIAKAARLAQEAAAQQGLTMQMGYAPLTGGPAASGTGTSGIGQAVDLQQRLNQLAQQSDAPAAQTPLVQQSADGGMLARLGNLDLAQLRHLTAGLQLPKQEAEQQQQQQRQVDGNTAVGVSSTASAAAAVSSIEELVASIAGSSKLVPPEMTAVAGAGSAAGLAGPANWSEMPCPASGLNTMGTAAAAAAAEPPADGGLGPAGVPEADGPIAKRQRLSEPLQGVDNENVVSAAVTGAGGSAGVSGEDSAVAAVTHDLGADPAWGQGQSLMKVNLQDALKTICAIAQQQ